MKVLWLSRHAMTAAQTDDLRATLGCETVEVTPLNITFPARSADALQSLNQLVAQHDLYLDSWGPAGKNPPPADGGAYGVRGAIAGVMPAHIAAAVARARYGNGVNGSISVPVLVPVSVPAPAAEGESRGGGFIHSHWERV